MPIYTRTGDDGSTGLFGNRRVAKDDLRVEAYGTIDELNAAVGLVRAEPLPASLDARLQEIQNTLFEVGSELASEGAIPAAARVTPAIGAFERWIDDAEADLPPLRAFVLPAGHREACLLHLARTVCRRAERTFWALARRDRSPPLIGVFLNRLSDLLFVWARHANWRHGRNDVPWVAGARPENRQHHPRGEPPGGDAS